jgi:hypothetical protein
VNLKLIKNWNDILIRKQRGDYNIMPPDEVLLRVHQRIDDVGKKIDEDRTKFADHRTEVMTALTEIKSKLHPVPCDAVIALEKKIDSHIDEGKKKEEHWFQIILQWFSPIAIIGLLFAIYFGWKDLKENTCNPQSSSQIKQVKTP